MFLARFAFFIYLAPLANGLNILFVLPCFGGHFGTMTPLILSLSASHDVTVIGSAASCTTKIEPLRKLADFNFIEAEIAWDNMELDGLLDMFRYFVSTATELFKIQFKFLRDYLSKHRDKFDLMVTDLSFEGSLVAAEVTNMPTLVLMTAIPGAVEHCVDKMGTPYLEMLLQQILFRRHWNLVLQTRVDNNLPAIVYQNNFHSVEYAVRFPTLIATTPNFYPEPHPNAKYLFIGGVRNESHYSVLGPALQKWLDLDERSVIYISLGTIFNLDEANLIDFVDKARRQKDYRFIWSASKKMQRTIASLELESDETLYFSKFLPQFTLLGHPKVKMSVTHGGLGSIIDLVKRRKPAICTPQLFDQPYNCEKMESFGVVETITFSYDNVNKTIRKILSNYENYVINADRVANELERYESVEAVEKFLTNVASGGKVDMIKNFGFDLCSPYYPRAWLIARMCSAACLLILLICVISLFRRCLCGNGASKRNTEKSKLS